MAHRISVRHCVYGLLLSTALAAANPVPAYAQEAHQFSVQSTDPTRAIHDFGDQAGLQIIASTEELAGKRLHQVSGVYSTDAGLNALLKDTGLRHHYVGERTVALVTDHERAGPEGENGGDASLKLQEIVVSAQKVDQNLQDVPMPVTAIGAASLADNNQQQLRDYFYKIPGVSFQSDSRGLQNIVIRGLTTGATVQNPTVAVVIDDMPLGSSTGWGGGSQTPDIDPSALTRIEVLRGPQGTFYGASTLGGLIKYVTADPSTSGFSGRVQAGANDTKNGRTAGYNVGGSANVPLGDTLALRVSGFARRDPGYIDNLQTGERAANRMDADGGMLSALWRPSDTLSLKVNAIFQYNELESGNSVLVSEIGSLATRSIAGAGRSDIANQIYSATLKARVGEGALTLVSGYSSNEAEYVGDATSEFWVDDIAPYAGVPAVGVDNRHHTKSSKFTQEARYEVALGERFDWMLGAFYARERSPWQQILSGLDAGGTRIGTLVYFDWAQDYDEYSGFTNLTVKFTDRFNVQVGGRLSHIRQSIWENDYGPYAAKYGDGDPTLFAPSEFSADPVTYSLTPQLELSADAMVYGRLATGYRPGGNNVYCTGIGDVYRDVPCSSSPDKTRNYELGLKGTLPGLPITYDASAYYIDWQDIQLTVYTAGAGLAMYTNAGNAKSTGIELSLAAQPIAGLQLSAWGAWNDAKLVDNLPETSNVYAAKGDRLPLSPRISGSVSADYDFAVSNEMSMFFGGSLSYIGMRAGPFPSGSLIAGPAAPRVEFPSYVRADLRAGVRHGTWTANLFSNNLTDRRGIINAGYGITGTSIYYIQPRSIGLSVAKTF